MSAQPYPQVHPADAGAEPDRDARKVVRASDLGRRFGRHWALAHVDLEVSAGETLLLAGANGSGKTTLLRLVAGLLGASRGRLEVLGGDPVRDGAEVRRGLTLVSHATFLYDGLTARETVELWARLRHVPMSAARVGELLEEVGLAERADEPVRQFSAGMRKRLSLARVQIEEPELLLFDEPFAALDPEGQELIESWLARQSGAGRTLLIASHALQRAIPLCRRAIRLEAGQIVWRGEADRLPMRPARRAADGGAAAPPP